MARAKNPNSLPSISNNHLIKFPIITSSIESKNYASALAEFTKSQDQERKEKSLKRWKKIRDGINEVKDERRMNEKRIMPRLRGWEMLLAHVKNVSLNLS